MTTGQPVPSLAAGTIHLISVEQGRALEDPVLSGRDQRPDPGCARVSTTQQSLERQPGALTATHPAASCANSVCQPEPVQDAQVKSRPDQPGVRPRRK